MKATSSASVLPALLQPQTLQRNPAGHHDGLERTHQRFHKRVIVLAIERIEAIVEPAQADGVQRQRGHVVNDVDLVVGVQSSPLLDQLLGDIEHAGVVGLHGAIAERRHQDVVRLAPVRLVGIGGKQSVAADRAHPAQRTAHRLVEALFVAEFLDQIVAGDDHQRRAHHVEPEDRPEFLAQPHKILHRRGGIQRQHVADHRLLRRMRDRVQFVDGRHCKLSPACVPRTQCSTSACVIASRGRNGCRCIHVPVLRSRRWMPAPRPGHGSSLIQTVSYAIRSAWRSPRPAFPAASNGRCRGPDIFPGRE